MAAPIEIKGRRKVLLPVFVVLALVATVGCQLVAPYGQGNYLSPVGVLDAVAATPGGVRVTGWAAEWAGAPDIALHGPEPTRIMVMIDGQWVAEAFMADGPRPDVDAMFVANPIPDAYNTSLPYRRPGAPYGFDITIPVAAGSTSVCVVAVNTMYPVAGPQNLDIGGDHALLGCRTVTVG